MRRSIQQTDIVIVTSFDDIADPPPLLSSMRYIRQYVIKIGLKTHEPDSVFVGLDTHFLNFLATIRILPKVQGLNDSDNMYIMALVEPVHLNGGVYVPWKQCLDSS